jgi:hypothetical protein
MGSKALRAHFSTLGFASASQPVSFLFSEGQPLPTSYRIRDFENRCIFTYGEARVLLAGDAEGRRKSTWRAVRTPFPSRSSTSRSYTRSELRFRALLIEGVSDLALV